MSEHKENVPKLRFPGFSGAWEGRRLGELIEISSASRVHKEEWTKTGIPFFRSSDVVSAFKGLENEKAFISYKLFEELSNKSGRVQENDLLVTGGGSIGVPYKVRNNEPLYFKDADLLWFKRSSLINSDFLYTYMTTSVFRKYVSSISHIGTISHYTIEQAKATPIVFPKVEEQIKISNFFVQIVQLITTSQRKLNNVKNLKAGLLQKMFPKNGEDFPEVRFPGFTDAWEQREYGEVIDLLSGQDFSSSEYNDRCNGIPYMTGASCIVGKETIVNRWTTVARCLAEKGDVLLVCKGSGYGAIAVLAQDKAHIARQFMALKNLPNLDKVFNLYLLNSVIENIKKDARGLIAGIARDAVLKQEISIPLLEEQSQIGTFFSNLDNLITLHQRKLEHLQEQKKALLQQMFV